MQTKNFKLNLYTVQDDHFPKRNHQSSRSLKLSSRKKKLQDDYDIFQFLKNDSTTKNFVTALTERKEIVHNPQSSVDKATPKQSSLIFDKEKKILTKFNEIQQKRKEEQLLKADYLLQKDLRDLNRIAQNSVQSFSNHFTLYNQFFIEKLMEPSSSRHNLQLKPSKIFTVLQNPNKKDRSYQPPIPKPFIQQEKLINEQPLEQIKKMNQNLQKVSNNLTSKLDLQAETYYLLIQQGDADSLRTLLKQQPKLISAKSRLLETGLHVAVKRNRIKIVELLLNSGIDEFAKDIWGQTARQIAFKLQYRNILQVLKFQSLVTYL